MHLIDFDGIRMPKPGFGRFTELPACRPAAVRGVPSEQLERQIKSGLQDRISGAEICPSLRVMRDRDIYKTANHSCKQGPLEVSFRNPSNYD